MGLSFSKLLPVNVHLTLPAAIIDRTFLSVTVDSSTVKSAFELMKSQKVIALAKGLTEKGIKQQVYLRIGGSDADHIIFDPTMYILNVTELDLLCKFVSDLGWKLIYDLNSLLRDHDGSWDSRNAIELITFFKERNFSLDYELGNEPDLYPRHLNITIPPRQLAKDFQHLHNILNKLTEFESLLIGPDIATLTRYNYFEEFLSNVSENVLDGVSFHHYYSSSDHISVHNFTDIKYLDEFLRYGLEALTIIKRSFSKFDHPPVWIGETSSTYGGGNQVAGQSFAAGFVWLDKLGLAAQMNISNVMRQALVGGYYSLLSHHDFDPLPDYWSSVLYKRLMGHKVLFLDGFLEYNRETRLYAHCINRNGGLHYDPNSLVLMFLNLNPKENANIKFVMNGWGDLLADLYLLQPAFGNLSDQHVTLNGQLLKMLNDDTMPVLQPLRVAQPYVLPPLTYGFLVVLNSTVDACF